MEILVGRFYKTVDLKEKWKVLYVGETKVFWQIYYNDNSKGGEGVSHKNYWENFMQLIPEKEVKTVYLGLYKQDKTGHVYAYSSSNTEGSKQTYGEKLLALKKITITEGEFDD